MRPMSRWVQPPTDLGLTGGPWHGMTCMYFIPLPSWPELLHPSFCLVWCQAGICGICCVPGGDGVLRPLVHGVGESPGRSCHGELCLQSSLVSCSTSSATSPLPNPRFLTLAL